MARRASLLRVLVLCAPAVAALFAIYEVVETTWLADVDPEVLHTLHLLRGLSAATLAASLTLIVWLRQTSPSPGKPPLPSGDRSWRRRLQHVSLRTKIAVPMVGLAVVPAVCIGAFAIVRTYDALRAAAVEQIQFDTTSKARSIQGFLDVTRGDLRFLSQVKVIRNLASAEDPTSERAAILREEAEKELLLFSQGKRAYYQVRYLDRAGREVVRLDLERGVPTLVPPSRLQDKSHRYYVKAALAREPGEVYVSPMDLNVELGRVEVPHRRVLRYATRVRAQDGSARGLLVINLSADHIVSLLKPLSPGTQAWLVSSDGTYLGYAGESAEAERMYRLESRRRLDADYAPREVAAILRRREGGLTLSTPDAFVSAESISFTAPPADGSWTLLIAHPRGAIEAPMRYLVAFLSVVTLMVAAVTAVIGILVGHYLAGPVARLRRATREIATGNLFEHVEIATGDEIEALATDFNTMIDRLREAQDRLSTWNEELEREVASQTDQLRQLQTGLARADKIASIGQLTAGVMHEIGNPLAAIKTKIQVAQEEDALCRDGRALVADIVREIDRLAAFLRSFSRLSRLPEPAFEPLILSEVVRSVVELLAPALRRRELSLLVEVPADLPSIRGDASQLRQLLINLVLNAAEASPDGATVELRAHRGETNPGAGGTGAGAILEVLDHGEGMRPEVREKAGNPFFTTKADGTGLGLAICRQIARSHGASMKIDSQPSEGTAVTVAFPVAADDPKREPGRSEAA